MPTLNRSLQAGVQILRGEIGAVGPNQCAEKRMNLNLGEVLSVPEWFENLPVQLLAEIDFPFHSILKLDSEDKPTYLFNLHNSLVHFLLQRFDVLEWLP